MLGPIDAAGPQQRAQQLLAAEHVQRQVAVAVVVAVEEAPLLLTVQRVVGGVEVQHQFLGRGLKLAMNCSTSTSCKRTAVARLAQLSRRHSVGALATSRSTPTAVCIGQIAPQCLVIVQILPAQRQPYTRWRSMSRTACVMSSGLRGSAMQRAAASISPSRVRRRQQHHASVAGHAAAVEAALHHASAQPPEFITPRSSSRCPVQFGFGIPQPLRQASATRQSGIQRGMPSSLLRGTVKFPG